MKAQRMTIRRVNEDTQKTTIVPEIIEEAKAAGCENDAQIHGYLAADISRLRSLLAEVLETQPITDAARKDITAALR